MLRKSKGSADVSLRHPAARRALHLAWDSCLEAAGASGRSLHEAFGAERLFHSLDGRVLFANRAEWKVRVYSVFDYDGARWVQLDLESAGILPLILKMAPGNGVKAVVSCLAGWIANPSAVRRVLEVH